MSEEDILRAKTATLTRMLNLQGTIGMFGHVSIRVPGTDTCFISPGASTEKTTVRPEQIFTYNIDGTIIDNPGGLIPLEWRIHTQIHRDRPDAMCVCHLHAPHARALGIAGKPLKPVFLHGSFLCTGVPTWDNPRLVVMDSQAADLSRALGNHRVAQMRGHGSVVVGATAEEAFFACTFLEENAQIQLQAEIMGGAIPLERRRGAGLRRGHLQSAAVCAVVDVLREQGEAGLMMTRTSTVRIAVMRDTACMQCCDRLCPGFEGTPMKRRDFIAALGGAIATWPLAARAQQDSAPRRLGVLMPSAPDDQEVKKELAAFTRQMQSLGWTEGGNLRVDYRWSGGDSQKIASLQAKELVDARPDIIFVRSTPATAALLKNTRSIPIVFAVVSDPVGEGFVASVARPGGNVTGFTNAEASLSGKWLGLLKEVAPKMARAGYLFDPKVAPGGGSYYTNTYQRRGRRICGGPSRHARSRQRRHRARDW